MSDGVPEVLHYIQWECSCLDILVECSRGRPGLGADGCRNALVGLADAEESYGVPEVLHYNRLECSCLDIRVECSLGRPGLGADGCLNALVGLADAEESYGVPEVLHYKQWECSRGRPGLGDPCSPTESRCTNI